jgi:hypothetical protein
MSHQVGEMLLKQRIASELLAILSPTTENITTLSCVWLAPIYRHGLSPSPRGGFKQ